jgi:hypothetical protein
VFPRSRDARWNLTGAKNIRFWIKVENPNLPGFQNAGPVLRLFTSAGSVEFKPAKDANLLNDPPFSEARWTWMPVVIPLSGDAQWKRTETGRFQSEQVDALSISLDSWGWEPFNVWLDGLSID